MFKKLGWVALTFLFALPAPAFAQSTAAQSVDGYLTNSGCPGGYTPCFIQYGSAIPVTISPGPRTIVPLDVSTVTTGGTAVTALATGHKTAGGFLYNPIGATINLCINEQGTASGTTSAGALTCIQPGQAYTLAPSAGAVSVITSDSSHPFSGYGLQ